jgi:hypothetical protein
MSLFAMIYQGSCHLSKNVARIGTLSPTGEEERKASEPAQEQRVQL